MSYPAHIASITRSLQDLQRIPVNDVTRIIKTLYHSSKAKKEKGFKLHISSYKVRSGRVVSLPVVEVTVLSSFFGGTCTFLSIFLKLYLNTN